MPQKRASFDKPDTRREAFETGRGWRGCRLAVTDGKNFFSGEINIQVKDNNSYGEQKRKKRGDGDGSVHK